MRIYIFTNLSGKENKVEEKFEGFGENIIVKEIAGGQEKVYQAVEDVLQRDEEKLAIVLVRDPIGATIVLNKISEARAAMCTSANDVKLAAANSANIYILGESYNLEELSEAIAAQMHSSFKISNIFKRKGKEKEARLASSAVEEEKEDTGNKEEQSTHVERQGATAESQKPKEQKKVAEKELRQNNQKGYEEEYYEEKDEEAEDDSKEGEGKRGLFSTIKKSLGFEDEE